jgi:putative transposase
MDGVVSLSAAGKVVEDEWLKTALIRPNVGLDSFIIMPDHLHGIILLHPP